MTYTWSSKRRLACWVEVTEIYYGIVTRMGHSLTWRDTVTLLEGLMPQVDAAIIRWMPNRIVRQTFYPLLGLAAQPR